MASPQGTEASTALEKRKYFPFSWHFKGFGFV